MRFSRRFRRFGLAAVLPALALTVAAPARAADTSAVNILIVKEQGVGGAAQAQPFVDKLVGVVAQMNGWSASAGKYATTRESAEEIIHGTQPHYGIMSLGAFLALRGKHQLEVLGRAEVAQAGGRQYHVISSKQTDLAGCKGKTLATNHAEDGKFIDKVVAGGSFVLADFQVVATKRPLQTIKKVTAGEAECALVDDAQFAELARVEGGAAVKSLWKSKELPPMVVVAFPSAPAAEKKAFQSSLAKVCAGEGKAACSEVGIKKLASGGAADYDAVIAAYK